MLNEFVAYLNEQIGQPYLWGGQHTRLTLDTYEAIIHKREDGRGGYKGGPTYAEAAIQYCRERFEAGASILFAYDCSGLGVFWLKDVSHLWGADVNANTMLHRCTGLDAAGPPRKGWWVFRLDGNRASHIGYMIDDKYLIEAKGRKWGVVKTKFRVQDWDAWGIPKVFEKEIKQPEPQPTPGPVGPSVRVVGKSVWVRLSDSTKGKKLFIAHRGDTFPMLGIAPSGWYEIDTKKGAGFITNLRRYTIIE